MATAIPNDSVVWKMVTNATQSLKYELQIPQIPIQSSICGHAGTGPVHSGLDWTWLWVLMADLSFFFGTSHGCSIRLISGVNQRPRQGLELLAQSHVQILPHPSFSCEPNASQNKVVRGSDWNLHVQGPHTSSVEVDGVYFVTEHFHSPGYFTIYLMGTEKHGGL